MEQVCDLPIPYHHKSFVISYVNQSTDSVSIVCSKILRSLDFATIHTLFEGKFIFFIVRYRTQCLVYHISTGHRNTFVNIERHADVTDHLQKWWDLCDGLLISLIWRNFDLVTHVKCIPRAFYGEHNGRMAWKKAWHVFDDLCRVLSSSSMVLGQSMRTGPMPCLFVEIYYIRIKSTL